MSWVESFKDPEIDLTSFVNGVLRRYMLRESVHRFSHFTGYSVWGNSVARCGYQGDRSLEIRTVTEDAEVTCADCLVEMSS